MGWDDELGCLRRALSLGDYLGTLRTMNNETKDTAWL